MQKKFDSGKMAKMLTTFTTLTTSLIINDIQGTF